MTRNADSDVLKGFTEELTRFDQTEFRGEEFETTFQSYFSIFPWDALARNAAGFDLGCGSGRWARGVAPRVGSLRCIDTNDGILDVARRNLTEFDNVSFQCATVARSRSQMHRWTSGIVLASCTTFPTPRPA